MKLCDAAQVDCGDVVAFVGAGGKSSALRRMGAGLVSAGMRVLATTTTRIGRGQLGQFPAYAHAHAPPHIVREMLNQHRFLFLYARWTHEKVWGPNGDSLSYWIDYLQPDVVLIEADGSRKLPIKAPYTHEPVLPDVVTRLIVVQSLVGVGQRWQDVAYNADGARALLEDAQGTVRIEDVGRLLSRSYVFDGPTIGLVNDMPPTGYLRGLARIAARVALSDARGLSGVVLGDVRAMNAIHEVHYPVAAIVLAGGMSRRMGQAKVLMDWHEGRTIIAHIVAQLQQAGVTSIYVVTGHQPEQIQQALEGQRVSFVHNPNYARGDMLSSFQAGLQVLPETIQGALTVLGDQPQIQVDVIERVVQTYAETQAGIVAPSYKMRRGHPILIDRRHWPELLALPDGAAPRDVMNRYLDETAYVLVDNDSVLRDIDTPQDYADAKQALKDD